MCDNVEWYSGFTEVNIKNNFGKSDVSKLCIGTADSTPQENVGTIDHGIEENGPVESHTLASGLVCKPTGDMRIDLSLSNRSGEFNIASISDNSPKERTDNQTPGIAAADDKGRRNAVPSAGKDNNLKGPSLVRLQHQVYIPPFHGCDFDVPVDIRNSKGVKVCEPLNLPPGLCVAHSVVTIPHHNQNHSKPSIVVRILNISPIPQTISKHTPILTLADVTVLEGQDIPVTKNTIAQVEFNLQHMEDIFAKTGKPLEATKLVKHRIDIGDSAPVYKPPYRVPFQQQPVVRQHIEEMLQEDIIRPSASPFSAPVVLVEKKVKEGEEKKDRYLGTEPTLEPIWNRERIRRSQQDDPAVRNITGNVLRNNSRDYYLDLDGVLYRKSEDSRHGDLLVAPTALLPEIMKTYHDLPISGHTGYDKTYARIKKMFIWPGMSKDIKKYVDACISCAQRKTSPHAKPAPLKRFDIPSKPFYRIAMDVVGPLPVTAQKNKYILTVQDALTKYVEAFPMEDQKAPTVARTFVKGIILRHGTPRQVLTDLGTNFTSKMMEEMCQILRIQHLKTTAYRPQTNGALERFHRTLKDLSVITSAQTKEIGTNGSHCHSRVQSMTHSATGKAVPEDYPFDEILKPLQVRYDADSNYIAEFMQRMKIAHRNAIQTIEATTDRVHGQFNTKPRNQDSASVIGKLAKKWIGPYRITHLRGVNARIEEIHGRKEQLVHVNRLKRCLATEDPRDQLGNVVTRFRTHNREPPRRAEVQTVSGAGLQVARGNKKAGEKLTTGQPEFPPAEEPTSSGHPREATATTGPPEDFEGPITRTQRTTGTPRTPTTGAEAGARRKDYSAKPGTESQRRRAVPDYGTEFGDGWRGLFTPACWNQEGGGLSRGAEQPRGPQADLKEEEYLPNPISHQGRSPVSQDLVVFKH
ncbi:hypothetical protein JTB14_015847 [Gonioctena quinquepunctata]|nr:hypothetical protein JTB14_015847 [Gonioctena quinquepunctata]